MGKKTAYLFVVLLMAVFAWHLSRELGPGPAAPGWKVPSARDLERFKAEKGLRASPADLKKMSPAVVERVVDGDTVELDINGLMTKVRLLNVNTPETVDPRRPVQEYGREASAFVKSLLPKGTRVFYKFDVEKQDRYGRLLLHLYLEDGTWLNALLIRAGYAQLMTYAPNVSAADFFRVLEAKARSEGVGLWQISRAD